MGIRFRRHVNEATGDYAVANGEYVESEGVQSTVVLTMRTRKGSCAVAPEWGQRFHEITVIEPNTPRRVEAFTREALKFLVDDGAIRDLRPVGSVVGTTVCAQVNYTDVTGQARRVTITHRIHG